MWFLVILFVLWLLLVVYVAFDFYREVNDYIASTVFGFTVAMVVGLVFAGIGYVVSPLLGGAGKNYSEGQYTGRVVQAETSGIFWKTNSVQLVAERRVDGTAATVHATFAVPDPDQFAELKALLHGETVVTLEYTGWIIPPAWVGGARVVKAVHVKDKQCI